VQPDAHFYATLMGVVGAAGNLRLAMQLREEMALDGLPPCQVIPSPLPPGCARLPAISFAPAPSLTNASDYTTAMSAWLCCYSQSLPASPQWVVSQSG
jgi:hypothetical protein